MLNRSLRTSGAGSELQRLGFSVRIARTKVQELDRQLAGLESDLGTGDALPVANSIVPGAAVLQAAISSGTSSKGGRDGTASSQEVRQLEQTIQQMSLQLESIAAVLRSRRDIARNSITNIRS